MSNEPHAEPTISPHTPTSSEPAPPPRTSHVEVNLGFRLLMGLFAMSGGVGTAFIVNFGAVFSKYTKDPLRSTSIHFTIATILMVLYGVWKKLWTKVDWNELKSPQMKWWYVPMPGMLGSSFVAASIALTPQVTYGTFVGFFVFGQVATSLLCDHFAILGTPKNPLTVPRILVTLGICAAVAVSEGFNPSQGKHSWWATLLLCLSSVAVGFLPPFQALLNKEQSFRYGSPVSGAIVNYIFGTIWLGLISLLSLAWSPLESNMEDAPWYVWLSGLFGPIYVTTTCICPKYLGASLYFVSVVVGQLGMSLLIDATKMFPDNARDVTWVRCLCVAVVVIGVGIKNYLHERKARSALASISSPTEAADMIEEAGSPTDEPKQEDENDEPQHEVITIVPQ